MLSCLLSTAKKANSLTTRLVFSVPCDGDRHPHSSATGALIAHPQPSLGRSHSTIHISHSRSSSSRRPHPRPPPPCPRHLLPSPSSSTSPPLRYKVRPDPRAPAPVVLAALADHAQASTAALLALLSCRAVSRTWARLASDNAVWRAFFISRWGVPPSPPTRPSRPSPPPRTSSLTAARMKKLPPLPPDAASPLPLTTSPPPAPSWRTLYRARLALERRWGSPVVTNEIAWQPPARALSGHADSVYCLEFSRSHIFTGSRDRVVKV
ncbi:hypothetical protein B0H14DRAFT_365174 [Mycena olivaceomarginata]|nr:hypothetical protein B0H14DRAFT_365174 [Mycena olivaceomarginata]